MAVIIDIADAVVAEINGHEWASVTGVVAWRHYRPLFDLKEMATLHVTVIPRAWSTVPASRASDQNEYQIDVGVQQKVDGEVAGSDPLMGLVQEMVEFFRLRRLAAYPDAACVKVENAPAWVPEHLQELRQFTSVLTLTFRVLSAVLIPFLWHVNAATGNDSHDGRSWLHAKRSMGGVLSDPSFATPAVINFASNQTHQVDSYGNLYAYSDLTLRGGGWSTVLQAASLRGIMLGSRSGIENIYVHHTYSGSERWERWGVFSFNYPDPFLHNVKVVSDHGGAMEFCGSIYSGVRLRNVLADGPGFYAGCAVMLNGYVRACGLHVVSRVPPMPDYSGCYPIIAGMTGGVNPGSYLRDCRIEVLDERTPPQTPTPVLAEPQLRLRNVICTLNGQPVPVPGA